MKKLKIQGLRATPTILQLASSSTITPNGMIENIVVTLDSLEYPADFMILSPKVNLFGYPIILGQPWLAIVEENISCRLGNMTISNGQATKKFDLYPLLQPLLDLSTSIWLDLGDEEEELNFIAQLMMLHRQSFLKLQEEDSVLQSILTNICVVEKDVSESFVLELITYKECDENCTLLKEPDILHELLPCELEAIPISKAIMMESTTTVELSKGHNLHVNPKLTPTQME